MCTKKTEIMTLFNNSFLLCQSSMHIHESCNACDAADVEPRYAAACLREHVLKSVAEEKKLLNKVVIFFSLCTKSILVA